MLQTVTTVSLELGSYCSIAMNDGGQGSRNGVMDSHGQPEWIGSTDFFLIPAMGRKNATSYNWERALCTSLQVQSHNCAISLSKTGCPV